MSLGGTVGGIEWRRIIESEEPDFEVGFLLPDATDGRPRPRTAPGWSPASSTPRRTRR